jgi:hypothetical protein
MITTPWDHSQGRLVKGLHFVRLLYQLGQLALPIAVTLIEKTVAEWDAKQLKHTFKSEYLQQMLALAQQQVQYRYLLAESW